MWRENAKIMRFKKFIVFGIEQKLPQWNLSIESIFIQLIEKFCLNPL